jgi:hypothetical protein
MNVLATEKQIQIVNCLVEGNSLRATSRLCGVERNTVGRVLLRVGDRCAWLLNERMRGLRLRRLEFDEIWTYVAKKQRRVIAEDPQEYGDQFVFVALDPESKLVPSFAVGKRNHSTCWNFVNDVRQRVLGSPQVTTDGFRAYIPAIDDAFGAGLPFLRGGPIMLLEIRHGGPNPLAGFWPRPRLPPEAGLFVARRC